MPSTDRLVWIDVETTGLDPGTDALLEVACLVTDTDLNLLDEDGYEAVVRYSADDVDSRLKPLATRGGDDYVLRMHEASDLWGRLPHGTPLADVERGLLAYVQRFAPAPRQGRVAGNSVRLDIGFLEASLPSVASHVHYRIVDISTLAFLAEHWAGIEPMPKRLAHEAMSDIRESIAELRYLRSRLTSDASSKERP